MKAGTQPVAAPVAAAPIDAVSASFRRTMPKSHAEAAPQDKEKRRKERLGEIKLELHKALLDNLNLAALETASEADLRTEINAIEWQQNSDAHGGGDWNLVSDWIQAVSQQNASLLSSSIDASVESHIIGFTAEKSRLKGTVEKVVL